MHSVGHFFSKRKAGVALLFIALAALGTPAMAINISNVSGSNIVIVNGKLISGGGKVIEDGPLEKQQRPVDDFTKLTVNSIALVTYRAGEAPSLEISGGKNALKELTTKVKGGRLIIDLNGAFNLKHDINIVITSPALSKIELNGSGNVDASNINSKSMEVDLSGSGSVSLKGRVETADLELSGSGEIDASDLQASKVSVDLTGSGVIQAIASDSVQGDLTGSGRIKIFGNPTYRDIERTGSGSVRYK